MSSNFSGKLRQEFELIRESDKSLDRKLKLWKIVKRRAKQFDPNCNVIVFGSSINGTSLNGSDMDAVIILDRSRDIDRFDKIKFLENLKTFWEDEENSNKMKMDKSKTEVIDARIPLLRMVCHKNIEVELSVCANDTTHEGTRNTHLIMCYSQIDVCVVQLVVLIKKWANHHKLLGPFHHRLSGFGLTLMVIFFLQQVQVLPVLQSNHPFLFSPHGLVTDDLAYDFSKQEEIISNYQSGAKVYKEFKDGDRLGSLLMDFFKFYSDFQFHRKVISVRTGDDLRRDDCAEYSESFAEGNCHQWYKNFLIEEPFQRYNVARCTSDRITSDEIKSVFIKTYWSLVENESIESIYF